MYGLWTGGVKNIVQKFLVFRACKGPLNRKALKLEAKQPCNFERNKEKIAHNLKKNSQRPQNKKPRKFKLIKYIWLWGI